MAEMVAALKGAFLSATGKAEGTGAAAAAGAASGTTAAASMPARTAPADKSTALARPTRARPIGLTLAVMAVLAVLAAAAYLLVDAKLHDPRLLSFVLSLRLPTLAAMALAAAAIGAASIVFQSIINNRIVTPCLLGMNSLYSLVATAVVFFAGSESLLAVDPNVAFAVNLAVMGVVAMLVYGYLFRRTGHNVLYVLLVGTVLSSFFGSLQSTLVRVMDPNEYDALLVSLVADFNNVEAEIVLFAAALLGVLVFALLRELALLDVITLGKDQAVNLGVDYDRTVRRLLLGVVLCIACATALVGPVSFLGLIVANLARQSLKTFRHSQLVLGSALVGLVTIVTGQLLMEHVFSFAVPIGTFITVGGGLYFLYLLLFSKEVA